MGQGFRGFRFGCTAPTEILLDCLSTRDRGFGESVTWSGVYECTYGDTSKTSLDRIGHTCVKRI